MANRRGPAHRRGILIRRQKIVVRSDGHCRYLLHRAPAIGRRGTEHCHGRHCDAGP